MKVSVIMPTFNREKLITETIDSILNQTYKNIELIIVDNFSVDETESVVKLFNDNRIKYFKNQNNGIIAVNRNFGFSKSTGDFIAFCDSDDLWFPTKLEKQLNEFNKNPNVGLVCSSGITFNEKGTIGKIEDTSLTNISFEKLLFHNYVINSSAIVKKNVFDNIGLLDEDPNIIAVEDYELWLRIAKKYEVKHMNEPLVKYRIHENALQNQHLSNGKSFELQKRVYTKLFEKEVIDKILFQECLNNLEFVSLENKILRNIEVNLKSILNLNIVETKKMYLISVFLINKLGILPSFRNITKLISNR